MKLLVVCVVLLAASTWAIPIKKCFIESRVAGGKNAKPTQFPYQVSMLTASYSNKKRLEMFRCGGSVISDQIIITAAHCLYGAVNASLYLGSTNIGKRHEKGRIVINVKKDSFILHENYDDKLVRNDIALIKLPKKISFSDHIKPINLPRFSQKNKKFVNRVGWISGWGMNEKGEDPEHLQFAKSKILPDSVCENEFDFDKRTEICVNGSNGISNCEGDSGGPFAIDEKDGSRTLIGLVSYSVTEKCGLDGPVAHTRITAFLDWIQKNSGIKIIN